MQHSDVIRVINVLRQELPHPDDLAICFQCRDVTDSYIRNCQSYKEYRETCCMKCAQYCKECDVYYTQEGAYHHDECNNDSTEHSDDDECMEEDPEHEYLLGPDRSNKPIQTSMLAFIKNSDK